MARSPDAAPLAGITVVDVSRMVPGAVLMRALIDLGARVVKIEDPRGGDPMRRMPPLVGGMGIGFAVHLRGAESVCLDLREPEHAAALRTLLDHADVFVESFRPGTLSRWNLDPEALRRHDPRLIVCSLTGYWPEAEAPTTVGHDINFVASSGLLDRMKSSEMPAVQIADVATGLLGASAVLAALFRRERSGEGHHIVQPLQAGPLPFVLWPWADLEASGRIGTTDGLIGGRTPAYRLYRCADGRRLVVGCLEPKFWTELCDAVGRPELAPHGNDMGPPGQQAYRAMADHLASADAAHWLALLAGRDLPVTLEADIDAARGDAAFDRLLEDVVLPATDAGRGRASSARVPGPAIPSLGRPPTRAAPGLGEHTRSVLHEVGLDRSTIDAIAACTARTSAHS